MKPAHVTRQDEETPRFETWGRRVDMPVFEGDNPERWIFRVERFFSVHHLTEAEKLDVEPP